MNSKTPMTPPPSIDGINRLVLEARNILSVEEQNNLAQCNAGHRIGRAVVKCQKMKRQLQSSEATGNSDDTKINDQTKRKIATIYNECVSQATCPVRYEAYDTCWRSYVQSARHHDSTSSSSEGLTDQCRSQRLSLERCMGNLVSEAIDNSDRSS
jgi:hypothetical protein